MTNPFKKTKEKSLKITIYGKRKKGYISLNLETGEVKENHEP